MNDVISFLALAGMSLLTLAAVGWAARPSQERLPTTQLGPAQWAEIVRDGVRVLATWGPRFRYPDRQDTGTAPTPHQPAREHTTR